ncbi:outer membrane beta-barrel protein [Snuella lapsa]
MKKHLLLALYLLICLYANAQEYAFGIKGGFNYYNIGDINSRGGSIQIGKPDETFSPNKELGTQFGAFLNIAFNNLFFRPELNFATHKNNYNFPIKTSKWNASKINVPLLIGYKVFDPISIYTGPSINFFKDMTIEGANNIAGRSPIIYEKTVTNIHFGIQAEFKYVGVDLRYELGIKETQGEHGDNYQDFHNSAYGINIADIWPYTPSQISLSLNVYLFRTEEGEIKGFFSNLFKGNKCYCPG